MAERYSSSSRRGAGFHMMRAEQLRSGILFTDPDFPCDPRSLYLEKSPSFLKKSEQVVWKRATEISKTPLFISQGAERHDLDQGEVGDCWFLAGAATLVIGDKSMFQKVVPPDQGFGRDYAYAGIFHFNFWWYGEWTEVVVDDYLPTKDGKLIYCRNNEDPNEFWPALLEKAYAKLHGCYEALDGGLPQDAMVDLTGGVSQMIDIRDIRGIKNDREKAKKTQNLYQRLCGFHKMNSLQAGGILQSSKREHKRQNGLIEGHAYSIVTFYQVKQGQQTVDLLRLRNPWGDTEWTGAWSDKTDEGEFWMNIQDFVQNFDIVLLCHLQMDDRELLQEPRDNTTKENWKVEMHHGEWIKNYTAGGKNKERFWTNPQFVLELKEPDTLNSSEGKCTLIVSLMHKRPNKSKPTKIGFKIYPLKTPDGRPLNKERRSTNVSSKPEDSGEPEHCREVTRRFELSPGHYVIIPFTEKPNKEAKFILRLYTEKFAASSAMQ